MRSLFTASILGLALSLGITACAGSSGEALDTSDTPTAAEAALSASSLAGSYTRSIAKGNGEEFETIDFAAGGSYTATRPSPTKGAPIAEAGSFRVSRGVLSLQPSRAAVKRYTLSSSAASLTLTRAGTTQTERFDKVVAPAVCASNGDCATGEECRFVSLCPPAPPGGVTCMAGTNKCVKVAQLGDSCGFRTQSTACATGLDCRHVGGPLDALTCAVHVAGYDEACGGFIRTAAICADGLECTHTDSDGTLFGNADGPGRCREGEGSACGGLIQGAHDCAYPLHCQLGTIADKGGVCQP